MAKEADIRNTLKEALSLLHSDEKHGLCWSGQFLDMSANLHIARFKDRTLEPMYQGMMNVEQDIWNVCTLIQRLEWLRNLAIKGQVGVFIWMQFASLDIEHFHVELRSILDYAANILVSLVEKPEQVPRNRFGDVSFGTLYHSPRATLGEEASELVLSASWYSELGSVRNSILHSGAHTLVFGSPRDGILFQVHKSGFQQLVKHNDALMWNENVVDFQLYAGLYFAKTIIFLERFGKFLATRFPQQLPDPNTMANFGGLGILRDWMSRLLVKVEG